MTQCIGTTWKGKRCKCHARTEDDYCSIHTPFPETVKMYYIQRQLKPVERLPARASDGYHGGYRRHPYPKLFHTPGAAHWWLKDNWNKITQCAPGKKLKSASIESVTVPNNGLYVKHRRVDYMFAYNS